MSSNYLPENAAEISRKKVRAKRWQLVLIISILIALLFSAAGLVASGLAYFGLVEQAKFISRVGTIMIVVSAPLFTLAAHCLDEMRFEEKSDKKEKYLAEEKNMSL